MSEQNTPIEEHQDVNKLIAERKHKLAALREQGNAFPNDFRRDATSDQLHAQYEQLSKEELEAKQVRVTVAGRIMLRRVMGKASFATIQDVGGKIQLYVALKSLPEGVYEEGFKKWDLGDIIGGSGVSSYTPSGKLFSATYSWILPPTS